MRKYLTIFPYLTVDGFRDVWMLPPELKLAAIGFERGFFCKRVDNVDVSDREGLSVGMDVLLDAGLVAVCELSDEADMLNDQMIAAFSNNGRQVVMGATQTEFMEALRTRLIQAISESCPAVQTNAFEVDSELALRMLIAAYSPPEDLVNFAIFREWALNVFDFPDTADMYPPGVFWSSTQTFGDRATAAILLNQSISNRQPDCVVNVIMQSVEITMLRRCLAACEQAGWQ